MITIDRKELLKQKYASLRKFGYSSKEANKLKSIKTETLIKIVQSEKTVKAKKTFEKEITRTQEKYKKKKTQERKKANKVKFEQLKEYKNKFGQTQYRTRQKVNNAYVNYTAKFTIILMYQTTETMEDEWLFFTISNFEEMTFNQAKRVFLKYIRESLEDKYKAEVTRVQLYKAYKQ